MIGIITALRQESNAIRRCFYSYSTRGRHGDFRLWEWTNRVVLLESGMGIEAATAGASLLVHHYSLHRLYAVGFAGSVVPAVQTGDLVIGEEVYRLPGAAESHAVRVFASDPSLGREIEEIGEEAGLRYRRGALLTVEQVVETRAEKCRLGILYPIVAIDMESGGVAAVAHQYGLPFLAVRVVFDPLDRGIPSAIVRISDRHGAVIPRQVICAMALHPRHWLKLLRITQQWLQAQQRLSAFCRAWWKRILETREE